jgi:hypothetical protein
VDAVLHARHSVVDDEKIRAAGQEDRRAVPDTAAVAILCGAVDVGERVVQNDGRPTGRLATKITADADGDAARMDVVVDVPDVLRAVLVTHALPVREPLRVRDRAARFVLADDDVDRLLRPDRGLLVVVREISADVDELDRRKARRVVRVAVDVDPVPRVARA